MLTVREATESFGMTNQQASAIRGLGEVALRVNDLPAMQQFYSDVIGLTLMQRFETSAFFRIAEGVAGHTQVLALFDRSAADEYSPPHASATSLDHVAFAIGLEDFAAEHSRLQALGLEVTTTVHSWVKWRSLYVKDPEGNLVELVCFDESID
jgi:catechol 2,3-dioxygenase